jgi:hypothetical protein
MNRSVVLVLLIVGITGCAEMIYPQNAAEYRARVSAPYIEKLEIKRPFRTVSDVLRKKSAECLDVSLTRRWMEPQGMYSIPRQQTVRYRPAVRLSAAKAELQVQVDDGTRGGMQKVPEGGMYILVVDAYPAGSDRTRIEIYGGGEHFYKAVAEGVKSWATGANLDCPKLP